MKKTGFTVILAVSVLISWKLDDLDVEYIIIEE